MIVNSIPHFRSGANNQPIKPPAVPLPSSDELLKNAQQKLANTPAGTPYKEMSREAQIAIDHSSPALRGFIGWISGACFMGLNLTNNLPLPESLVGATGSVAIAVQAEKRQEKLLEELAVIAAQKAKQLGAMK